MPENIPILSNRVKIRHEGGQWMMISPAGKVLTLNHAGKLVAELCDGSRTVDEIVGILTKIMDAPSDGSIAADVAEFISQLEIARCLDLIGSKYESPRVQLVTASGLVGIREVDPKSFHGVGMADPPCH